MATTVEQAKQYQQQRLLAALMNDDCACLFCDSQNFWLSFVYSLILEEAGAYDSDLETKLLNTWYANKFQELLDRVGGLESSANF